MKISKVWNKMYYTPYKLGPHGAQLNAIAGIDIALWDIAGKVAGRPVHALFGGSDQEGARGLRKLHDAGA